MAKAYMRTRSEEANDGLTADSAITKLAVQKWEALKALSNKCVEAGDKYRLGNKHLKDPDRLYTLEEAKQVLVLPKGKAKNQAQTIKKMHGGKKSGLFCDKCAKAGLTGLNIRHDPKDCDPVRRRAKVNKERRFREQRAKPKNPYKDRAVQKRPRENLTQKVKLEYGRLSYK